MVPKGGILLVLPVARIFYGEVRSNTETDQTMLEAQVFVGGAGGGGRGENKLSETAF